MHKKGHYGAALTAYAPVGMGALALGFDAAAVGGGLVAVGLAMFPDVGMNVPNLSHRGLTHTVHFVAGVAALTGILGGIIGYAATGHWLLTLGSGFYLVLTGGLTICSHIAADALTPMGSRHSVTIDTTRTTSGTPTASSETTGYSWSGYSLRRPRSRLVMDSTVC